MKFWDGLKRTGKAVGPGFIAGASDDDPSAILTYLQSGFVYGFQTLWLAVLCLPFMYALQEMAGRIGFVTDKGLMSIIKDHYAKWVLYSVGFISVFVIAVNIGADLLAIGVIGEKLSSISRFFWLPAASILVLLFAIFLSYPKFASVLKWLSLSFLFYVATVFYLHVDWLAALKATVLPSFSFAKDYVLLVTAFFGVTISPYLFFWQADEEVEERDEEKKERHLKRFLVTKNELKHLKRDTFGGMFFSQIIAWFVIVAAAQMAGLHNLGEIADFGQAALVLEPLLGPFAFLIFGLGIIGAGLIAVPVLAGSIGYVLAEMFDWKTGMNRTFREAKGFYLAIVLATALGVAMNFLNLDPIRLLIYSGVLYTFITPPIIFLVIKIANNETIMNGRTNSPVSNALGWLTFAIALFSVIAFVIFVL